MMKMNWFNLLEDFLICVPILYAFYFCLWALLYIADDKPFAFKATHDLSVLSCGLTIFFVFSLKMAVKIFID